MNVHKLGKCLRSLVGYHARILLASFGLLATPLHAADDSPAVYTGTVGAARVVMELDDSDGDVTGRYFYRKYRLDIGLNGSWKSDTLALESRTSGDRLTLRRAGSGLAGWLVTSKGRRVSVSLSETTAISPAPAGLVDLSPYDRAQLAGLSLVPGAVIQDGTRSLRTWREPVSGITLFRIDSGYPPPVLHKINAALERQQWQQVSQWFSCEGFAGKPGMEVSEARAPYTSDDFVSYVWFGSWSCAGTAHPDFGSQGFTFDARTGRELQLEDLLYFGTEPVPEADTSAFYAYRSEVFAPHVVTLLQKLYPQEMQPAAGNSEEDECDYTDSSVWDFPSWHLTPQGLYAGAYFARAQRPCDEPEWSIIPWQHLSWRKDGSGAATTTPTTP